MNASQNNTAFQTNADLRLREKAIAESEQEVKQTNVSNLTVGVSTGVLGGVAGVAASKLVINSDVSSTNLPNEMGTEPNSNNVDNPPTNIKESFAVTADMSFNDAFAAARNDVGPGGVFSYKGHYFGTYLKGEWDSLPPDVRMELNKYDLKLNVPHLTSDNTSKSTATQAATVVNMGNDDEDAAGVDDDGEGASYDELDEDVELLGDASEFTVDKNIWLVDESAVSEGAATPDVEMAELHLPQMEGAGETLADAENVLADADEVDEDEDEAEEEDLSAIDDHEVEVQDANESTTPIYTDADHLNKLYADISASIDPNAVYTDEDHLKSLQAEMHTAPAVETAYSDEDHLKSLQAEMYTGPAVETVYSDEDHLKSLQAEIYTGPAVETVYSDEDHLKDLQAEIYTGPAVETVYSDEDHLKGLQAELYTGPTVETGYSDEDHLKSLQAEMHIGAAVETVYTDEDHLNSLDTN